MAGPFDIEIEVTENVTVVLKATEGTAADLAPAMGEIARYLAAETQERFRTETDPEGVPWKPSLRVTGYTDRNGKQVKGDGGQTLTLKGDLRRSIKPDWGADYAAAGPEASGGAAVYAKVHQDGATIRPRAGPDGVPWKRALRTPFGPRASVKIPARRYLGFTERDGVVVTQIIGDLVAVPFKGSLE